jgi:putative tryptophan/tyrosine transport system substrate-binding protein
MKRREFIAGLGGAVAWPLFAQAQQARKLPTIGLLGTGSPSIQGQWWVAFVQRLHELDWVEGRTIAIERRWAEGRTERFADIAAEFVRLKVDVIVTASTPAVIAAKRATSLIPIVVAAAGDPVGNGLVTSLARPGGNVTGLSQLETETAGKRLELLREMVPGLRRLAILVNPNNPAAGLERDEVQIAARALGLQSATFELRQAEDFATVFDAIKGKAEALYVCLDPLFISNRSRISTLAVASQLPTMHDIREFVEVGGLMSYGPDFPALYRRAGDLVDKILRGTKPADIPIEQPTQFDLSINLTTAKALGLTIPETLLATADEVIQ